MTASNEKNPEKGRQCAFLLYASMLIILSILSLLGLGGSSGSNITEEPVVVDYTRSPRMAGRCRRLPSKGWIPPPVLRLLRNALFPSLVDLPVVDHLDAASLLRLADQGEEKWKTQR